MIGKSASNDISSALADAMQCNHRYVAKRRLAELPSLDVLENLYLQIVTQMELTVAEEATAHETTGVSVTWRTLMDDGVVFVRSRADSVTEFTPRVNTPLLFNEARNFVVKSQETPWPSQLRHGQVAIVIDKLVRELYSPARSSEQFETFWPMCDWLRQEGVARFAGSESRLTAGGDAAHEWWVTKLKGCRVLHPNGEGSRKFIVRDWKLGHQPAALSVRGEAIPVHVEGAWYSQQARGAAEKAVESWGSHVEVKDGDNFMPVFIGTQMKWDANANPAHLFTLFCECVDVKLAEVEEKIKVANEMVKASAGKNSEVAERELEAATKEKSMLGGSYFLLLVSAGAEVSKSIEEQLALAVQQRKKGCIMLFKESCEQLLRPFGGTVLVSTKL